MGNSEFYKSFTKGLAERLNNQRALNLLTSKIPDF